jgi:hypothetical protein
MKGPYQRLKFDLRRLWECPVCKRRERTDGMVTFRHCACGTRQEDGRPVVMKMIADGPQRLVPVIAAARGQCAPAGADSGDAPASISTEATASASAVQPPEGGSGPG